MTSKLKNTGESIISWQTHLIGFLTGLVTLLVSRNPWQTADDFASEWIAGWVVREGSWDHLYDHEDLDFAIIWGPVWPRIAEEKAPTIFPHPFVQEPLVATFHGWLTHIMSFAQAYAILVVLSCWAAAVMIGAAWYIWTKKAAPTKFLFIALTLLWLTYPFQIGVNLGQTSLLVYGACTYAIAAADRRPILSGILLALATLVKLSPAIFVVIFLVFKKTRKAGVVSIIAGVFLGILSLLTAPWSVHLAWIHRMRAISKTAIVSPATESLESLWSYKKVWEAEDNWHRSPVLQLSPAPMAPKIITAVVTLAFVALLVWAACKYRNRAYAILSVGALSLITMSTGLTWHHYFVMIAVPLIPIYLYSERRLMTAFITLPFLTPYFPTLAFGATTRYRWPLYILQGGRMLGLFVTLIVFAALFLVPRTKSLEQSEAETIAKATN